jgi:hypothetical protein
MWSPAPGRSGRKNNNNSENARKLKSIRKHRDNWALLRHTQAVTIARMNGGVWRETTLSLVSKPPPGIGSPAVAVANMVMVCCNNDCSSQKNEISLTH